MHGPFEGLYSASEAFDERGPGPIGPPNGGHVIRSFFTWFFSPLQRSYVKSYVVWEGYTVRGIQYLGGLEGSVPYCVRATTPPRGGPGRDFGDIQLDQLPAAIQDIIRVRTAHRPAQGGDQTST